MVEHLESNALTSAKNQPDLEPEVPPTLSARVFAEEDALTPASVATDSALPAGFGAMKIEDASTTPEGAGKDARVKDLVPQDVRALATRFGLGVQRKEIDGQPIFTFTLALQGGEQRVVASGSDLDAVTTRLQSSRRFFEWALEQKYNIEILENGATTTKGDVVRAPNLRELSVLDYSMQRSLASATDEDDRSDDGLVPWLSEAFDDDRLRLAYAAEATLPGAAAYYLQGNDEKRAMIVFDPGSGSDVRANLHEIAHNGQFGFWQADNRASERYREYTNLLGWTSTTGGTELIITNTSPPRYFRKVVPDSPGAGRVVWMRSDLDGNFLNASGEHVKASGAEVWSNSMMRANALVHPASDYFDSPKEHGAELITKFRESAASRAALLALNAQSYNLAKQLDQRELDAFYGVDSAGMPLKLRQADGLIVDNNAVNREAIQKWETEHEQGARARTFAFDRLRIGLEIARALADAPLAGKFDLNYQMPTITFE